MDFLVLVGAAILDDEQPVVGIGGVAGGGQDYPAGGVAQHYDGFDVVGPQRHIKVGAVQGVDSVLSCYYFAIDGPDRLVDYLQRVADRRLPGGLALAEGLVPVADFRVAGPKYGSRVADHDPGVPRRLLQRPGLFHHASFNGVGNGVHHLGVKVGDKQGGGSFVQGNVWHWQRLLVTWWGQEIYLIAPDFLS